MTCCSDTASNIYNGVTLITRTVMVRIAFLSFHEKRSDSDVQGSM